MAEDLDIPMPRMMPAAASSWRAARPRQGLDSSTRRLAIFAGAIGGGLLLVVGVWSLRGHHGSGAVPVMLADSRPLRTKPEDRGGMQVAGQDDAILSGDTGGKDEVAPPPETPDPKALRAAAQPPPATPSPVASPQAAPAEPPPVQPASLTRTEPTPPPAPLASLPEHPTRPATARIGGLQVQLAALATEDGAHTEWVRLQHKLPDLLADRQPSVLRLERDGKVFWRLRTGGFADVAEATGFCARVRAKGLGCTLAASQ